MAQPSHNLEDNSFSVSGLPFTEGKPQLSDLKIQTWASNVGTVVAPDASPKVVLESEKGTPVDTPCTPWSNKAARLFRKLCGLHTLQLPDEESPRHPSQTTEAQFQPVRRTKLEDLPSGYSRLAGFQTSDEAFGIYRRFDYLHARVILDLQYDISKLEQSLMSVDKEDNECEDGKQRLTSRASEDEDVRCDEPNACKRRKIMAQLREMLLQYDDILVKSKGMATLQRPYHRDYTSVVTWFNNCKPLAVREWYSLRQQDDMVTLRQGREWAFFDGWIEGLLQKLDPWFPPIGWIFKPQYLRELSTDDYINYYHPRRVEALVAIIITAIIFILLVIPVVLMYNLTSIGDRNSTFDAIGVMVVFTLVFSAAMSLLTKAKRHELFGASAAYCAVLVVFISNFNGSSRFNN